MIEKSDLNIEPEASVDVNEHGAPIEDIELGFFVGGYALTGTRLDEAMSPNNLPTSPLTLEVGEDWPFVSDGSHNDDPAIIGGYGR